MEVNLGCNPVRFKCFESGCLGKLTLLLHSKVIFTMFKSEKIYVRFGALVISLFVLFDCNLLKI